MFQLFQNNCCPDGCLISSHKLLLASSHMLGYNAHHAPHYLNNSVHKNAFSVWMRGADPVGGGGGGGGGGVRTLPSGDFFFAFLMRITRFKWLYLSFLELFNPGPPLKKFRMSEAKCFNSRSLWLC